MLRKLGPPGLSLPWAPSQVSCSELCALLLEQVLHSCISFRPHKIRICPGQLFCYSLVGLRARWWGSGPPVENFQYRRSFKVLSHSLFLLCLKPNHYKKRPGTLLCLQGPVLCPHFPHSLLALVAPAALALVLFPESPRHAPWALLSPWPGTSFPSCAHGFFSFWYRCHLPRGHFPDLSMKL